jgi:hypothetical protein
MRIALAGLHYIVGLRVRSPESPTNVTSHQPATVTVEYVQYSTVLYDRLLESSEHQIFIFSFAFNENQIRAR